MQKEKKKERKKEKKLNTLGSNLVSLNKKWDDHLSCTKMGQSYIRNITASFLYVEGKQKTSPKVFVCCFSTYSVFLTLSAIFCVPTRSHLLNKNGAVIY
jgi:hypothetical protein